MIRLCSISVILADDNTSKKEKKSGRIVGR